MTQDTMHSGIIYVLGLRIHALVHSPLTTQQC